MHGVDQTQSAPGGRNSCYDTVPYRGTIIPLTSPAHLSLCSRWHSDVTPRSDPYRLVELGCGDGANLLALAFYHPESMFLGIDSSENELGLARENARCLGIENLHFVHADVRDADPAAFAPCDFLIAHGLYSWVSYDVREAILRFCRESLGPSGLAYISYNAQPGWATRRLVRETLLRSRLVRDAAIEEKATRAIEVATQLLEDLPSRNYASAVLLAKELECVRDGKPFYVLHEYLAEVNEGFWLGDFVERARSNGLEYVADAQFCRWEGRVSPELRAALAKRDMDRIEQEEAADLLGDRFFRASILCRMDAERSAAPREDLLEQVHIATSLAAESDRFHLKDGVVERFAGVGGAEITLEAAITKAAVVLLAAQWPRGTDLRELYSQALALIAAHGYETTQSSAETQLRADLVTLFEAGQIDLRLQESQPDISVAEFPAAHNLARFEAGQRDALSTPYHRPLPFEPAALAMICQLNGVRSQAELRRDFGAKLVDDTLTVLARWGLLR